MSSFLNFLLDYKKYLLKIYLIRIRILDISHINCYFIFHNSNLINKFQKINFKVKNNVSMVGEYFSKKRLGLIANNKNK